MPMSGDVSVSGGHLCSSNTEKGKENGEEEEEEVWTKEDIAAWWANEGSCAPEFDESVYEVVRFSSSSSSNSGSHPIPRTPAWERTWDGGTGLPIRGMGLMKPGTKGFGPGGDGGSGGGGEKKGRDDGEGGGEDDEGDGEGEGSDEDA